MLRCPKCGLGFAKGVRFCDQDGSILLKPGETPAIPATPPASTPIAVAVADSAPDPWEQGDDYFEPEPGRKGKRIALAAWAILLLGAIGGAGYAYSTGLLDRWIGHRVDPALPGSAPGKNNAAPAKAVNPPMLRGTYKANLADQDITLTFAGDTPRLLAAAEGSITYRNVVTRRTCTSSLKRDQGASVGGDATYALRFRQEAVPGMPACPADIPVKIDLTGEPQAQDGVVEAISVMWFKGSSEVVVMSGKLTRDAGK